MTKNPDYHYFTKEEIKVMKVTGYADIDDPCEELCMPKSCLNDKELNLMKKAAKLRMEVIFDVEDENVRRIFMTNYRRSHNVFESAKKGVCSTLFDGIVNNSVLDFNDEKSIGKNWDHILIKKV